jgi:hypothetical protein
MPLKELVEINIECHEENCVKPLHPHEIKHALQYFGDERGYVKFRDRNTGKFYFQGQGTLPGHAVWFAEKEE